MAKDDRYVILERRSRAESAELVDDWDRWSEWTKDGIRSNRAEINEIRDDITEIKIALKVQQVRVGIWGAIGASLPTIIGFLILFFRGNL